jgi:hypothetical protein
MCGRRWPPGGGYLGVHGARQQGGKGGNRRPFPTLKLPQIGGLSPGAWSLAGASLTLDLASRSRASIIIVRRSSAVVRECCNTAPIIGSARSSPIVGSRFAMPMMVRPSLADEVGRYAIVCRASGHVTGGWHTESRQRVRGCSDPQSVAQANHLPLSGRIIVNDWTPFLGLDRPWFALSAAHTRGIGRGSQGRPHWDKAWQSLNEPPNRATRIGGSSITTPRQASLSRPSPARLPPPIQ